MHRRMRFMPMPRSESTSLVIACARAAGDRRNRLEQVVCSNEAPMPRMVWSRLAGSMSIRRVARSIKAGTTAVQRGTGCGLEASRRSSVVIHERTSPATTRVKLSTAPSSTPRENGVLEFMAFPDTRDSRPDLVVERG